MSCVNQSDHTSLKLEDVVDRLQLRRKGLRLNETGNLVEDLAEGRGLSRIKNERVCDYIEIKSPKECWIWLGARCSDGYGSLALRGKSISAHRFIYIVVFGSIPDGAHVLHKCDNPSCVNPFHLFIGSHKENMIDRDSKGRCKDNRGMKNGRSKLSNDDIEMIRFLSTGKFGEKEMLARQFGVSGVLIGKIIRKELWAHL